jgi:hypothetical protein
VSDAAAVATAHLSARLEEYFPTGIVPRRERDSLTWMLPCPEGADYRFQATVLDEGDPHILGARLLTEPDAYFWYRRFESPDFDNDDERRDAFLAGVESCIANSTRVVAKSGLLSVRFSLQVAEGTDWSPFSTAIALRTTFDFPNLARGRTIFLSPPLVSAP